MNLLVLQNQCQKSDMNCFTQRAHRLRQIHSAWSSSPSGGRRSESIKDVHNNHDPALRIQTQETAPGYLHFLVPLPGTLKFRVLGSGAFCTFRSKIKCHLPRAACLEGPLRLKQPSTPQAIIIIPGHFPFLRNLSGADTVL